MFDNCISQVKYESEKYQTLLNYIESNQKELKNWEGKPKYDMILEAIEIWKKEIYELEKTFVPAMEELKNKIINREHLKLLGY